jgi:hypothetical protein
MKKSHGLICAAVLALLVTNSSYAQDGKDGADGADGVSVSISIGIGNTITSKGKDGLIVHGADGAGGADGADGSDGQDGADGADGAAPIILPHAR